MKKREFVVKAYLETFRRIRLFNIKNSNIRGLADREYCYKKMKRKFRKIIKNERIHMKEYDNIEYSNKIWICWFQGLDNAPILVKKCVDSIMNHMPNSEIIIITSENFSKYVDIPEYIIKKFNKGIISYAHFSDILRMELLTKYGGYWIDATVYMTDKQNIFEQQNTPLFVYKNVSLNRKEGLAVVASSWLIYSCKNNHILEFTKQLLYTYWKKNNILINYNLVHIFFTIATEIYYKEWEKVPTFSNIPPHLLQFELLNKFDNERLNQLKQMSCFHKLNRRVESENKDNFYYYIVGGKNEKI